jgi:hypothetical protein
VAEGSEIGRAGDALTLEARLTLMTPEGEAIEVLALTLSPAAGGARPPLVLPLAPVAAKIDYTLIHVDANPPPVRPSDIACLGVLRGTGITMPDGRQHTVETLQAGDRVLTRDHGAQPVRWVGRRTVRAVGAFAPVVIPRGTLGNLADLIVTQQQRLFVYRRGATRLSQTAETFVPAGALADGETVRLRSGGFAEIYHLAFDRHEIVYLEGIAAESLLVDAPTLRALPEDMASDIAARLPGRAMRPHVGTEPPRDLLRDPAAPLLRRLRDGR